MGQKDVTKELNHEDTKDLAIKTQDLSEMIGKLSPEEKKEFAKILKDSMKEPARSLKEIMNDWRPGQKALRRTWGPILAAGLIAMILWSLSLVAMGLYTAHKPE